MDHGQILQVWEIAEADLDLSATSMFKHRNTAMNFSKEKLNEWNMSMLLREGILYKAKWSHVSVVLPLKSTK